MVAFVCGCDWSECNVCLHLINDSQRYQRPIGSESERVAMASRQVSGLDSDSLSYWPFFCPLDDATRANVDESERKYF